MHFDCNDHDAFSVRSNKSKVTPSTSGAKPIGDVEDAEGPALLIPDIQRTSRIVSVASRRLQLQTSSFTSLGRSAVPLMGYHCAISHSFATENAGSDKLQGEAEAISKDDVSLEEKYMRIMQKLQFGE